MHAALLIDEILRLIFETILNDDKPSLCSAARCCQAWKEPALDLIWRRLPSAIPLLSLLPGFSVENETIRLDQMAQDLSFAAFESYSARVKHVVHCHRMLVDMRNIPIHLFDNVQSARIETRAIGEAALCMSMAGRLRTLALQVGYGKSNPVSTTVHSMLSLLHGCSSLEQLSVRGHSSECLHEPLSGITTLRSLSLHLSSLTEQSFMAVSTLPLLVHFDVHADHLSHSFLSTSSPRSCGPFFPALEKLKIRSQAALVALIVQQLPRNKLRSLYVDVAGSAPSSAFDDLFNAMAPLQLHEFTLEHVISEETPTYPPHNVFTLDQFRLLSKLPLRRCILDTSFPPDLSDSAIEEMVSWWPSLDRLELGSPTALGNTETTWKPGISLAGLSTLARGCKHLKSLVITLDLDPIYLVPGSDLDSHPTSLSISSRSRPDISLLSAVLSRLFPSLRDVTPGFVGEHEDVWTAIQANVSTLSHK